MDFFLTSQERDQYGDAMRDIPWFGGNHDSVRKYPVVPLGDYLLIRDCPPPSSIVNWIISDPDEALPMVQSWLFFGVIEAALWDSFGGYKHFKDTPNGKVLNTRLIRGLKLSWELRLAGMNIPVPQWQGLWNETRLIAEQGLMELGELAVASRSRAVSLPGTTESAIDEIIRGSVLLLEHLMAIAPPVLYEGFGLPQLMTRRTPGMEEEWRGRLLSQGWCSSTYKTLGKISGSVHLVEYASCFPATDGPSEIHDACSEDECVAYNMDTDTAQAKHRQPDCNCANAAPDLNQVITSINGDTFPVIDMRVLQFLSTPGISDEQRDLLRYGAVSEYQAGMKFVAISHVWSDGLMGTTETGLPECQVQYLANLAFAAMQEISSDPVSIRTPWFLWIDALCIPANPQARRRAITQMRKIYSEASMTIVLDEGMYRSTDQKTIYSIMFRIMTCAWSRRLWTLQEAILSKNIYILFSAGEENVGLVKLSDLYKDLLAGTDVAYDDDTIRDLAKLSDISVDEVKRIDASCRLRPSTCIETLMQREFRSIPLVTSMELNVKKVAQLLLLRNSSRREDELLAIAPLLGADVSKLVHSSGEDRVKSFWLQIGTIPKDVIMLEYPKLSTPGFRCLPRTMMGLDLQLPMHSQFNASVTERGVRGKYWVYQWSKDCNPAEVNCTGTIVDKEARYAMTFTLHGYEPNTETVPIDAILLHDIPDKSVTPRPLRGFGVQSSGVFHDGCEIFSPGRILYCSPIAPLEGWDKRPDGGIFVVGKVAEAIIG